MNELTLVNCITMHHIRQTGKFANGWNAIFENFTGNAEPIS